MKTRNTYTKYVEWLSADEMHRASQEWLSELRFIKDEHLFLEDLITTFTMELIHPEDFMNNTEIVDAVNRSQRQNYLIIEAVKTHENDLKIMVDGEDQPKKEAAYKEEHRGLIVVVSDYLKEYKMFKSQLFDIIKNIKKQLKQERLIDRE